MLSAPSIVIITILSLEAVLTLIGNTFTIFVFWTHRSHLKRTCLLLINLAVADLLVGVSECIILGTDKIHKIRPAKREENGTNPSPSILLLGSTTSVLFLALISLERAYAVLWPFRHRVASARVYISSTVFVWAFGFCTTGISVLSVCYPAVVNGAHLVAIIQSCLFVALLVICASYLKIRTRLRYTTPELEDTHNRSRQARERNLRMSRTFFIVTALSLVFWLPAFVVYSIREICKTCFSSLVLEVVHALRLANSMVNPFVYTFRMPIFKDALKKYLRRERQDFELRPVA